MHMSIHFRTILFLSFTSLSLLVSTVNAQQYSDAIAHEDNHHWQSAMIIASMYWNSHPTHYDSLRCKLRNGYRTGMATYVVDEAKWLMKQTGLATDKAYYVEGLALSGRLDEAIVEARNLLDDRTNWPPDVDDEIFERIDQVLSRTYEIEFTVDPVRMMALNDQDSLPDYIQVPIPRWMPFQRAINAVEGAASYELGTVAGGRYFKVWPDGDQPFVLRSIVKIFPMDRIDESVDADWGYPPNVEPFTEPSFMINSDDPIIVSLAEQLRRDTPYETVKSVLGYCSRNLHFIPPGETQGGGKATETLARGYGHCEGLTTLAAALLRANDIPARLIRGHSRFVGDSGHGHHHSILEYYLDGVKWTPWDYGQHPGIVSADFLALWRYSNPLDWQESDRRTWNLMVFQRLGLLCEYVNFNVVFRN